ncbi:methyltransferase domain-containing protein [Streptomyces narbonensis]
MSQHHASRQGHDHGQNQPSHDHGQNQGHDHGQNQGHGQDHGQGPTHDHEQNHGQGAGHHHDGTHLDWSEMALLLERQAEIASPAYTEAAAWLGTLAPVYGVRRVLDVGSGPGVVTSLLADAFPAAETVAVDGSPELLERARDRAEARGLGARVSTLHAELPEAIGTLGEADLVWAGNSLHHIGDQRAALAEFADLLHRRPHRARRGRPAHPPPALAHRHRPTGIEARLDAAHAHSFGEMRAELQSTNPTTGGRSFASAASPPPAPAPSSRTSPRPSPRSSALRSARP